MTGTFQVPNYLTGTGAPGSRYNYGPDGLPARNGTFTARFLCLIPRAARTRPGTAVVYGHGLLGSRNEVNAFGPFTNFGDVTLCGTDIVGMASEDVGNVVQILQDNSKFATLADRLQQAILNFQFLARLMKDERGFASSPAFRVGSPGASRLQPRLRRLQRQQPGRHLRWRGHRGLDRVDARRARCARA